MEGPALLNPDNLPTTQTPYWNSVIKRQANLHNDGAVLATYSRMQSLGVLPTPATLPLVLKACRNLNAIEVGKEIHRSISNTDFIGDVRVGTSLVDFYSGCGRLREAANVFDRMPEKDLVAWNAMIAGCVEVLEYGDALIYCIMMQREGLRPNSRTAVSMVMAAGGMMDLRLGKMVHGYCLRNGFVESSAHVVAALIDFYLKFDLVLAECLFGLMKLRNVVVWNAMVKGYLEAGKNFEALSLFTHMLVNGVSYDSVTLLIVIQACREYGHLELATQVHQQAIKRGFSCERIVNALMNMYGSIGYVEIARSLFYSVSATDTALWNSMLYVYVEVGRVDEAVKLFRAMRLQGIRVDERTLCMLLGLCESLADGLGDGQSLQAYAIKCGMEDNAAVKGALLSLFGEVSCAESALKIFDQMVYPDVVLWNTLILALARSQFRDRALDFFVQMGYANVTPNSHTIVSILVACSDESYLKLGRSIHGYTIKLGIEMDPPLHTALTEMYLNCNSELTSRVLFENFREKDVISWNAMIACYANNNQAEKAMLLFCRLVHEMKPNTVSIINVLSLCTDLANLPEGRRIHAFAMRRFLLSELSVLNALITMYGRCGSLNCAVNVFLNLPKRNLVSWNAMIACYGVHGRGHDALAAFSKLLDEGLMPDKITFISILSACSHSGLIDKGLQYYQSMIHEFKIMPEAVHYACIVDLLARGGCFEKAWEFISSMPIGPDASAWRALLGACRVYSETKYALPIFEKLVELEPTNAGNYVLLSNIYGAAGQWSEVERLRAVVREKGMRKAPGKSWIVIRNEIHSFSADDKSHPWRNEIRKKVEWLLGSIGEMGYVPDLSWDLHDEEDEKKGKRLSGHSEKLAISFGLMRVRSGVAISVSKNLRICGDCHEFTKHVSKLTGREIIVRDGIRFHHFCNGVCSCNDYW